MKKLNSFSFLLALLLLSSLSVSAQRTFVSSIAERNATYLTIANQDAAKYFFSNASNQMIDVETNLSLNVKSDRTWCKPSVNGKKVTIAVDPNTEAPGRTATVTVYGKDNKSRTVAVTQLGTGSGILINEKEINLTNYRLDFSLGITGNILFTIDVPDWINESAQTPRIGFQEYTFSAKEITEAIGERRGFIVIKTANNEVPEIKIPVSQVFEGYPRFAVISDVHFGNSQGEGPMVKVPKALKNLTSHGKLDALFIVGDLTDGGTAAQYTQFVQVMSNPANFTNPVDTMIYMMGNHDNYATQTNYINGLKPLNNGKPYPMDQYIVIKGYPFITISQRSGDNTDASNAAVGEKSYPKEVQEKLRTWMKKAAEECPGKPIFVFTHVPPKHTCYSSWPGEGDGTSWPTWSMKTLNPILNEYPQAVVFGGHSHFPIGDPRSIHQGVNPGSDKQNFFTGINTGSTTYSEIHKPSVYEGIHPDRYAYVTEGMILSVQPNNDVKIQRYDTYRNEEMHPEKPWMLKAPHDGTMFRYADKRDAGDTNPNGLVLRNGLPAPVFADNAAVTLDASATNSVSVTFPQATDDEYVFRYRVEVKNSEGNTVSEVYQFSYFYLNSEMPATLTTTVGGLTSNTTYTVKVTALDSYDNASTSLVSGEFATGTYTPTPGSSKPAESTLILDVAFNENGTATDCSRLNNVVTVGSVTPETYMNETYNRRTAKFTGNNNCYYKVDYQNNQTIKNAFTNGFTFEMLYKVNNTSSTMSPVSAQESGGAGIEQSSAIEFWVHLGGNYKTLKATTAPVAGKYCHLTAVYDKDAGKLKMYVAGNPAGEMNVSGDFAFPSNANAQWIGIGGDAFASTTTQSPLNGEIVVARMYNKAVTRDEVYWMYKEVDVE